MLFTHIIIINMYITNVDISCDIVTNIQIPTSRYSEAINGYTFT